MFMARNVVSSRSELNVIILGCIIHEFSEQINVIDNGDNNSNEILEIVQRYSYFQFFPLNSRNYQFYTSYREVYPKGIKADSAFIHRELNNK